jgi:hypothetical protein
LEEKLAKSVKIFHRNGSKTGEKKNNPLQDIPDFPVCQK